MCQKVILVAMGQPIVISIVIICNLLHLDKLAIQFVHILGMSIENTQQVSCSMKEGFQVIYFKKDPTVPPMGLSDSRKSFPYSPIT